MIEARPNVPYLTAFEADSVPSAFYTLYNPDWTVYRVKTEADTYEGTKANALITWTEEWVGLIKWENDDGSRVVWDTVRVEEPKEFFGGSGQ